MKYRKYQKTPYVLGSDIRKEHGVEFMKKFQKLIIGSTGMIVPANHKSHGKKKAQFAIYQWDYCRFRDQILHGTPTYFD